MATIELDIFEEYFYRDLEKWFSADIACCDNCHSDFLAVWPYADVADDHFFQTQAIDLVSFYEGSILQEDYPKADFDRLVAQLNCPRCNSPLIGTIWAYNLPFSPPEEFERTVLEVSQLAATTPFLLLEHEFCRNLLAVIQQVHTTVNPVKQLHPLFRARGITAGDIPEIVQAFDFPPSHVVREGRYNHAGNPVLYLGSDLLTCHAELRRQTCLVLEFELLPALRVLDLSNPYESHQQHSDILNSLVYSALVSARQDGEGWHKPHYVVSRFVADCARATGFDAIRYPSTRSARRNFNLVLVNPSLSLSMNARVLNFHRLNEA